MGNQNTRTRALSDNDIHLLSRQTQLPPHIIQQLYQAFLERSGGSGRMTLSDFKNTYTEINPNANVFNYGNDAERIFLLFDIDQNGVLTFDEFMMAYILLQRGSGDPINRWQSVMSVLPSGFISRPGQINSGEALRLIQRMGQFYQIPNFDPVMAHHIIWNQLLPYLDPSGYVSQGEFLQVLSVQPEVQSYIW